MRGASCSDGSWEEFVVVTKVGPIMVLSAQFVPPAILCSSGSGCDGTTLREGLTTPPVGDLNVNEQATQDWKGGRHHTVDEEVRLVGEGTFP